jgi:hypothetical protein
VKRLNNACTAGNYLSPTTSSCKSCPTGSSATAGATTCYCFSGYISSGIGDSLVCSYSSTNTCPAASTALKADHQLYPSGSGSVSGSLYDTGTSSTSYPITAGSGVTYNDHALLFDGSSNAWVSFGRDVSFGGSAFSISVWANYITAAYSVRIFDFQHSSESTEGLNFGGFGAPFGAGGFLSHVYYSVGTFSSSKFNHFVLSCTPPTTCKIYFDGILVNTISAAIPNFNFWQIAGLGKSAYASDSFLHGKIADFRLFFRALTVDEVTAIHTGHECQISLCTDNQYFSMASSSCVACPSSSSSSTGSYTCTCYNGMTSFGYGDGLTCSGTVYPTPKPSSAPTNKPSSSVPSSGPTSTAPSSTAPSSSSPTSQPSCGIGSFGDQKRLAMSTNCKPCAKGTYSTENDVTICLPCPMDTTTEEEGSTNSSFCKQCPFPFATNTEGSSTCSAVAFTVNEAITLSFVIPYAVLSVIGLFISTRNCDMIGRATVLYVCLAPISDISTDFNYIVTTKFYNVYLFTLCLTTMGLFLLHFPYVLISRGIWPAYIYSENIYPPYLFWSKNAFWLTTSKNKNACCSVFVYPSVKCFVYGDTTECTHGLDTRDCIECSDNGTFVFFAWDEELKEGGLDNPIKFIVYLMVWIALIALQLTTLLFYPVWALFMICYFFGVLITGIFFCSSKLIIIKDCYNLIMFLWTLRKEEERISLPSVVIEEEISDDDQEISEDDRERDQQSELLDKDLFDESMIVQNLIQSLPNFFLQGLNTIYSQNVTTSYLISVAGTVVNVFFYVWKLVFYRIIMRLPIPASLMFSIKLEEIKNVLKITNKEVNGQLDDDDYMKNVGQDIDEASRSIFLNMISELEEANDKKCFPSRGAKFYFEELKRQIASTVNEQSE